MPSVFLSYARADAIRVAVLEQELREKGIELWRDQERLRGGQQWPKAIGEAIASHDFFLLAWSSSAASSHFVEFEWTTAVALRKPVLPCLLDATPLPPALSAVEGVDINKPDASSRLSVALQAGLPPSPPNHVSQVLNRLEEIGTTAPDVVVTQARAIYAQQGWNVQGNVYQATGNMYVTIQQPAKTKRANSKLETWSKRTALIATVLGIIISVIGLSDTVRQKLFPPATPLRGYVFDDNQQPVADATVEVDQLPGKPQTTASNGSFVFDKVPGNKGDRIRVFVKKSKYKDHNEYVALGDTAVRIKLEQSK